MKHSELVKITEYLQQFKKISSISRADDNVLKIYFERGLPLFVDLSRNDSYVFIKEDFKRSKLYNAPFDVILSKRFANSALEVVEVEAGNRILRLRALASSSYKAQRTILQLEFTGRNTNAIILDDEGIVLEALRHIDASVSFRSVKVGEPLVALPPRELKEKSFEMQGCIEEHLALAYQKRLQVRLTDSKTQKIALISKKIEKLIAHINILENEAELYVQSDIANHHGTLVLANLQHIKGYQESVNIVDFEGNDIEIPLPKEAQTPQMAANILFKKSKKLRQKALSVHRQKENLEEKKLFLERLCEMVHSCVDEEELNIFVPKQRQSKQKNDDSLYYETFFLEGYKIMLGKNEKGNITLLKEAKKSDIWLHIKEMPSAHVIIRTEKQNIPEPVLLFAAKLCVNFSVSQKGGYLVDYTPRKNVKPFDGANVAYEVYQTLKIYKE
ncbi:MAG: NFACT RNA binding domain-containing protein [Sulfurospirillaceae bacterium]|nr:NFACT RNA binding domain-containing protein [Sulfurospirillaceae bacterium]